MRHQSLVPGDFSATTTAGIFGRRMRC